MFSLRTAFTPLSTRDGVISGVRCTLVDTDVWVMIMIKPDSTPWPDTSPIVTHSSSSLVVIKS